MSDKSRAVVEISPAEGADGRALVVAVPLHVEKRGYVAAVSARRRCSVSEWPVGRAEGEVFGCLATTSFRPALITPDKAVFVD